MRSRLLGRAAWGEASFVTGHSLDYQWRLHGMLKKAED